MLMELNSLQFLNGVLILKVLEFTIGYENVVLIYFVGLSLLRSHFLHIFRLPPTPCPTVSRFKIIHHPPVEVLILQKQ